MGSSKEGLQPVNPEENLETGIKRNRELFGSIFNLLTESPGLTTREIAERLNIGRSSLYYYLGQMERFGYLLYESGGLLYAYKVLTQVDEPSKSKHRRKKCKESDLW